MNGKLSISRTINNQGDPKTIHITVEDESSGIEFLSLWITPENFANCITGLGNQDCSFDLRFVETVGKEYQSEVRKITVSEYVPADSEIIEALKGHEVDGWKARTRDFGNHHNYSREKDGTYSVNVIFTRYV